MKQIIVSVLESTDVLQRAMTVIQAGIVGQYAGCDPYCPWCAIADAKTMLDNENETSTAYLASDDALIDARLALSRWKGINTKQLDRLAALDILQTALNEEAERLQHA